LKTGAKGLEKAKAEQLVAIFVQKKLDVIIKCINSRICVGAPPRPTCPSDATPPFFPALATLLPSGIYYEKN